MTIDDIRYLFAYDRWATARVLAALDGIDEATWSRDRRSSTSAGSAGSSSTMLGAHQRWRHGLAEDGEHAAPGARAAPLAGELRAALGGRVAGDRRLAGRRSTTRGSPRDDEGVRFWQMLAARREPRDPAPRRGGRAPDPGRAVAGRPRHDRLRSRSAPAGSTACRRRSRRGRRTLMAALMDLVAGDEREILLAISVDDWAGFDDRRRFDAHLVARRRARPDLARPLLRGRPVRDRRRRTRPTSSTPGASSTGPATPASGSIERVDPAWIGASPGSPTSDVDAVAGRWIDLLEEELGLLPREEKPWIRQLAGDLVAFARAADRAPTSCSPGPSDDRRAAQHGRGRHSRNRALLGRLDGRPRRRASSTTSRASGAVASGSATTRSRCSATSTGRSLLHLQCHFGIDTLVVGSPRRAGHRRRLLAGRHRAGPRARGRARVPGARFVDRTCTTSRPNLDGPSTSSTRLTAFSAGCPTSAAGPAWSHTSSAPGGPFSLAEVHPVAERSRTRRRAGRAAPRYPYWEPHEPLIFAVQGSYADPTPDAGGQPSTAGTTGSGRS